MPSITRHILTLSALAGAAAALTPAYFTVTNVTSSGTGCPQGSVTTSVSSDLTTLSLNYKSVDITIGGIGTSSEYDSCRVELSLSYPSNTMFTVTSTSWKGAVQLGSSVSVELVSALYLEPIAAQPPEPEVTLSGPTSSSEPAEAFLYTAAVTAGPDVESSCGGTGDFVANSQFILQKPSSSGDSGVLEVITQDLVFSWSSC